MDQAALTAELNRAVLKEVFPIECSIAGRENLSDLCSGQRDFQDSTEGDPMDLTSCLSLLANAVTVITFVWTLLRPKPRPHNPADIDQLVISSLVQSSRLSAEQRLAIYLALMIKLNAEKD